MHINVYQNKWGLKQGSHYSKICVRLCLQSLAMAGKISSSAEQMCWQATFFFKHSYLSIEVLEIIPLVLANDRNQE